MQIGRLVTIVIAATLATTPIAYAGTDLEVFQKRALKNASDYTPDKFKNLCVCESNHRVGVMEFNQSSTQGGYMTCYTVNFDAEGELTSQASCDPWFPLPK